MSGSARAEQRPERGPRRGGRRAPIRPADADELPAPRGHPTDRVDARLGDHDPTAPTSACAELKAIRATRWEGTQIVERAPQRR